MSFTVNFFCDFMAKDFTPSVIDKDLKQIINSAKFNVINFEAPIHSPSKPILKSGSSHSQWEYGPRWLEDNGFTGGDIWSNDYLWFMLALIVSALNQNRISNSFEKKYYKQ